MFTDTDAVINSLLAVFLAQCDKAVPPPPFAYKSIPWLLGHAYCLVTSAFIYGPVIKLDEPIVTIDPVLKNWYSNELKPKVWVI